MQILAILYKDLLNTTYYIAYFWGNAGNVLPFLTFSWLTVFELSYLYERKFIVKFSGQFSDKFVATSSVPHRSNLKPLLYTTFILQHSTVCWWYQNHRAYFGNQRSLSLTVSCWLCCPVGYEHEFHDHFFRTYCFFYLFIHEEDFSWPINSFRTQHLDIVWAS